MTHCCLFVDTVSTTVPVTNIFQIFAALSDVLVQNWVNLKSASNTINYWEENCIGSNFIYAVASIVLNR